MARRASEIMLRVPAAKHAKAKEFQNFYYQKHAVSLPLWRCLIEVEKEPTRHNDPFEQLRRGFRLQ